MNSTKRLITGVVSEIVRTIRSLLKANNTPCPDALLEYVFTALLRDIYLLPVECNAACQYNNEFWFIKSNYTRVLGPLVYSLETDFTTVFFASPIYSQIDSAVVSYQNELLYILTKDGP